MLKKNSFNYDELFDCANGKLYADAKAIYEAENLKVGLFKS